MSELIDDFDIYINQEELMRLTSQYEPLNSDPSPHPDWNSNKRNATVLENQQVGWTAFYVDPKPHVSTQFFTFNKLSHALMIDCILAGRVAAAEEIRVAVPATLLESWRNVWKDRTEKTGYVTSWKRIQDKMNVLVDSGNGNKFLYFKSNSSRFVSYIEQWQDIVMKFHCEGDSRHLGVKDTIGRIKKMWTVNAKFYGIPESFIRFCVNNCPMCCDSSSGSAPICKRIKFEHTESCEVPVKQAQAKLQELAKEYKAVLCVKQKYIRYNPFAAEVKDYVCHRAGEPMSNDMQDSNKESHLSKRCGCMFRIRVIVPISGFNEDTTYVYQDDGVAVFELCAVHSGHEPGDLDESARIMHKVVGDKGGFLIDQDVGYGMREEKDESSGHLPTVSGNLKHSLLSHLKELKSEIDLLQGKIENMSLDMLASAEQTAFEALDKFRSL